MSVLLHRLFTNSQANRRAILAGLNQLKRYGDSRVEEDCLRSSIPDVEIPNTHLVEYVMQNFGAWHDKVALECGFTGRRYTYEEIRVKSLNLNRALRKKLRLQKEDVVALLLPNVPEFPICVFAAFLAGLRLTTMNPVYTSEEIAKQLIDADVKAIITIGPLWNTAKTASSSIRRNIPLILIKEKTGESLPNGSISFAELTEEKCDIPEVPLSHPHDTIFLPYSSGTTGLPKGVELTSSTLLSNLIQINAPEVRITNLPTDTHRDCMPAILPMFHIYGFMVSNLYSLYVGTKLITLPKFTPESYLETIVKHKPNILMLVPPIVIFLYAHPAVKTEYFKHLTATICGAAPLGALDEQKFREKVGRPIHVIQGYGLSEASPVATMVPKDRQGKHFGSIGHPLPNTTVKIIDPNDPDGKHLGPNKTGELLIKGPQVMKGYLNKPDETKTAFLNGWLRTGDLAYYNDDETFFIADRIKELIKVNAFQVPPAELEDIIRDHPGIADAAVIGVPHPTYGEVPRAYVVAKSGVNIDSDDLMSYVERKVARHKKLRGGVSIVESIPKNAAGKIMRRSIKQMYEEKGI